MKRMNRGATPRLMKFSPLYRLSEENIYDDRAQRRDLQLDHGKASAVTTPADVLAAARAWYGAGFCVVPPKQDGTKAPFANWKQYQTVRPTSEDLSEWYYHDTQYGVGLLCGQVSGNLEMFEAEGRMCIPGEWARIEAAIDAAGQRELWEFLCDGYSEWTPSGGLHLLYRVEGEPVPGNTKIASRPKDPKDYTDRDRETIEKSPRAVIMETLIETRGEGGYVVVAPSQGPVHPTGNPWTLGHLAEPGVVPTITWEQRNALVAALSVLDVPKPRQEAPPAPVTPPRPMLGSQLRVGDDFNARGDWGFLESAGWTVHPRQGAPGETFWVRPGKNWTEGHSASTGYAGDADRLYVWSSATEFPIEEPISRFAAYTQVVHNGDYRSATKDLSAQGYGEQRKAAAITGYQQFGDLKIPDAGHMIYTETTIVGVPDQAPPSRPAPPVRAILPNPGRESFTDTGTANRFLREHPNRFLYVRNWEEWLHYDGVIWQRDDTGRMVGDAVEAMVDRMDDEADRLLAGTETATMGKALEKYVKGARMNAGRKGLLATIAAKMSIVSGDLDPHLWLLGLRNAVLDVRTGDVLPSKPQYLITKQMDVFHDPNAKAPDTRAYLSTMLPNDNVRDYVQRLLAYTATGEQDQRAFVVVHGERGTGKSQFVELWGKMFGTYATVAADAAFRKRERGNTGPSAELHALQGARFVFASESDEDVVLDADIVKRVCGGESMSTRTLYEKRPTKWRPECVVWLATNHFPRFPADEKAVWDRVKPIEFKTFFERDGSSENDRILSVADRLFESEASGILNLLIEWLKRYREVGLAEPEELTEAIEGQINSTDPVARFWKELNETGEIVADPESEVIFQQLYLHYVNWCKDTEGVVPRGNRRFGTCLKAVVKYEGLEKRHGKTYLKGWKKMGYNGVLGTMWN